MPRLLAASFALALLLGTTSLARAQTAPHTGDAPEISRSAGVPGGIVLLWPRIIPRAEVPQSRALALSLQRHLAALIRRQLPGKALDIRPEPERVCRRAGCEAMSVNALLIRRGAGCVVVALVSMPGQAAAAMIPWAGDVQLKQAYANFREPPESQVRVVDFAMCDQVLGLLAANEPKVMASIRATVAASPKAR